MAQPPRLGEIVEMYESIGFEVRLEPMRLDDPSCVAAGCNRCFLDPAALEATRIVYTRPRS